MFLLVLNPCFSFLTSDFWKSFLDYFSGCSDREGSKHMGLHFWVNGGFFFGLGIRFIMAFFHRGGKRLVERMSFLRLIKYVTYSGGVSLMYLFRIYWIPVPFSLFSRGILFFCFIFLMLVWLIHVFRYFLLSPISSSESVIRLNWFSSVSVFLFFRVHYSCTALNWRHFGLCVFSLFL